MLINDFGNTANAIMQFVWDGPREDMGPETEV